MMTSDERRAIAARADEVMFDMGSDVRDVMRGLLHVLGVEIEGLSMWSTDGHCALARIRELCELPDDWYVERGDLDVGAGWQVGKYGKLDPRGWRRDLSAGFSECLRVLRPGGVLVFKWYEYRIPLKDVLACCPATPILGNRRPRASKTHWVLFMREG